MVDPPVAPLLVVSSPVTRVGVGDGVLGLVDKSLVWGFVAPVEVEIGSEDSELAVEVIMEVTNSELDDSP